MTINTALDIENMIANPAKYGFEWGSGPLNKKGMEVCKFAPHIVHKDVTLLRATFGDAYFLDSANGQSARVRDQTLRDAIWDEKKLASNEHAMKVWVLEKALGRQSRARRVTVIEKEVRIYVANDGTEFTDKALLLAHNVDLQLAASEDE